MCKIRLIQIKDKPQYITFEVGLAKLQKYCAYQDRCHQEVRSKLLDIGMRGHDLELVIVALIEENFLDEERFARSYARGKFRIKRWGRIKIRQELRRRGISAYCLKKAFEEIDEEEYLDSLKMVLEKKLALLRKGNFYEKYKKLYEHAFRKGYEPHLVSEYAKMLLNS